MIEDLTSFIEKIQSLKGDRSERPFYRGHSKSTYENLPKVFREPGWEGAEEKLLRALQEMHPDEFLGTQLHWKNLLERNTLDYQRVSWTYH